MQKDRDYKITLTPEQHLALLQDIYLNPGRGAEAFDAVMKQVADQDRLHQVREACEAQRRKDMEASGQLTLSALTRLLEEKGAGRNPPVRFEDGSVPDGFHSYRGYYDHLAMGSRLPEASECPVRAQNLLRELRYANGGTYHGWKGGEFVMGDDTPVWRAEAGVSPGQRIIGVELQDDELILKLAPRDDY